MNKWLWWCNTVILYSFYVILFFVPIFFTNDTSELFEFNKMWLTFWLTIPIVSAWLCKMVMHKKLIFQRTPLDIPLGLFLLSQVISTVISTDPHISFWGYYSRFNGGLLSTITYLLLYYALVSNFGDLKSQLKENTRSLSLKALLLLGGGILYVIGLFLSPPSSPTAADGKLFLFYSLVTVSFCMFLLTLSGSLWQRFFSLLFISGVVVALWGLPSHFGIDPTCYLFRGNFNVGCWTDAFRPTLRIFSTMGQPDWMAAYLCVLLLVSISYAVISLLRPNTRNKNTSFSLVPMGISVSLSGLFYLDLLFTFTRAGFIAFWLANIFFWIVVFLLPQLRQRKVVQLCLSLNLLFLLLNFLFYTPFDQINKFSLQGLTAQQSTSVTTAPTSSSTNPTSQSENSGATNSGDIRLYVWNGAIASWKDHPLFGTGVETFAFTYYKYRPVAHNMTSEWDFLYNKAHNEYLNFLATTGAFGLGTYLLFIFTFLFLAIKYIWKNYGSEEKQKEILLTLGLITAYITILVTNFFGFSVVMLNIFLFLIPALFLLRTDSLPLAKAPQQKQHQSTGDMNALQWTGIVVVLLIALYCELILVTDWNADKAYAMGHNLDQVQQYTQASSYLSTAVSMRPDEPVFQDELSINDADLAAQYLQSKDINDAQKYAIEAKNINDTLVTQYPNNILFWKSRSRIFYLLSNGDPKILQVALQAMERATQLAPTDAKILYNLGVLYGQTGDVDRGIQVLEKTIQYKPDYRDAYYALGLFYHDKATDKNGHVIDQAMEQKAVNAIQYILQNLNKDDPNVKKALSDWGE